MKKVLRIIKWIIFIICLVTFILIYRSYYLSYIAIDNNYMIKKFDNGFYLLEISKEETIRTNCNKNFSSRIACIMFPNIFKIDENSYSLLHDCKNIIWYGNTDKYLVGGCGNYENTDLELNQQPIPQHIKNFNFILNKNSGYIIENLPEKEFVSFIHSNKIKYHKVELYRFDCFPFCKFATKD